MALIRINHPFELICITGMDGSGKTTQARLLVSQFTNDSNVAIYKWSRGEASLRRWLLKLGRLAMKRNLVSSPQKSIRYSEYEERKKKLFASRWIRLVWKWAVILDHVTQIWISILPHLIVGKVVVCDRYIWDSMIDLAVTFDASNRWLEETSRMWIWRWVPKPGCSIFLDVPSKLAQSRKADIGNIEYLKKRRQRYLFLASSIGAKVVDGSLSVESVHQSIMKELL